MYTAHRTYDFDCIPTDMSVSQRGKLAVPFTCWSVAAKEGAFLLMLDLELELKGHAIHSCIRK